ncbi:MAG: hypothetical protein M1812_000791 [Candelaria pacifica]|nr:MAG: hypothetical protein M1812_000791 [Candelaria pacifica]
MSSPPKPNTSTPSSTTTNTTTTTNDPSPHPTQTPPRAAQFQKGTLSLTHLSPSPITQFKNWYNTASSEKVPVPETVTLSTASLPSGRVSARMVYLKEVDSHGRFIFYSNWDTSQKAADVNSNPYAALTFWWRELERQVRVEGRFERLSDEESQVYFDSRIRGSRIGAWASRQSSVLEGGGREQLDRWVKEVESRFEGEEQIPVPGFWGGGRVVPDMIEFWQGRESRLHDRFRYTRKEGEGEGWKVERLSP